MLLYSDNHQQSYANEATPLVSESGGIEYMTESDNTINCDLPENKNNPVCNIADTFFDTLIIIVIITLIVYSIIIYAAVKTKNNDLKIFLIISMFVPFLAPIGLIFALLIIANAI